MNEVACPRCGTLVEGSSNPQTCPSCGEPLVNCLPSRSPDRAPELDVAALVRDALAEQQPGEEFESALRRVTNDPRGEGLICQVICKFLEMQACRLGTSRQQAAEQLAKADTRLKILPDGTPFLETLAVNVAGLESLPPGMREDVLRQINEAVAQGKAPPAVIHTRPPASGRVIGVVVIAVLFTLALAYLLSR
jgi:hypothetical protein